MDHAASQLLDNDILAASALNDISVVVTKFDMSTELHDEDPWGPVTYHPSYEVQETIDCSSLREAALKEIKRRGLD